MSHWELDGDNLKLIKKIIEIIWLNYTKLISIPYDNNIELVIIGHLLSGNRSECITWINS